MNRLSTSEQGKRTQPLYRSSGSFLLRVPAFPFTMFSQIAAGALAGSDLGEEDFERRFAHSLQESYQRIDELLTVPFVQESLAIASTDLLEAWRRLKGTAALSSREKRVYSRLARYLVRMSTRTTPFGLFAGVALGTFAETTHLALEERAIGNLHVRPDVGWLFAFLRQFEQQEQLLPDYTVMVNATAQLIGDRLVLPSIEVYGRHEYRTLSLRAVPALRHILIVAGKPIRYKDLVRSTSQAFPHLEEQQIQAILLQLWASHVLISTLRPPLVGGDPTTFVLKQIQALPQTPSTRHANRNLTAISGRCATLQQIGLRDHQAFREHLIQLIALQKSLVTMPSQATVQIDAALTVTRPSLHAGVADALAEAAEVLLRLGSHPTGLPSLDGYRAAFVKKYGMAEVPLLRLLNAETGLGVPSDYTHPPRVYPLPAVSPLPQTSLREKALFRLLARALYCQETSTALTDADIQSLTQWTPTHEHPAPPEIDVFFQIQAAGPEAIDRGEWEALVLHGLTFGGRAMGRFADVLGEEAVAYLRLATRDVEALSPDVIFADLTYLPSDGRGVNVSLHPALHPYEIAVNTLPSRSAEFVLSLDDLVVGVRDHRFYVRSLRLDKEVKVYQHTMLHLRFAPNECRFLLEIAWDGCPYPEPFNWGIMNTAPFLPRLTYKNIVLSLAQWHVRFGDIHPQGKGCEEVRWFRGLQQWRQTWRVPRYVYVVSRDQRLLLDLEHPLLALELWRDLKGLHGGECVCLQEMLPDADHLVCHDSSQSPYVAEMVLPLVLRSPTPSTSLRAVSPYIIPEAERVSLPGEDWVSLKLYIASLFQEELIAGPVRELAKQVRDNQMCDRWFFIRYADPEPHVRLRFHAVHSDRRDALLMCLLGWGNQLVRSGRALSTQLVPYEREIERYGGPQLIGDIERLFSANSDVISDLVAAMYKKQLTLDPLVTAVLSLDSLFQACSYDFRARLRYVQSRSTQHASKELFRSYRKILLPLAFPWRQDDEQNQNLVAQRSLLQLLLRPQLPLAQHIARQVDILDQVHALWNSPEQIFGSLAHMQSNRLGIDEVQEQVVYNLWRHLLEAVSRRPEGNC